MITGKQLQEWRRSRNITVEEVAKGLDVSHRTVEGWETRDLIPETKQASVLRLMEREFLQVQIQPDIYARVADMAAKHNVPVAVLINDLLADII